MKIRITFLLLLLNTIGFSQVGFGTATPHSGAVLDLTSSNKGLLLPRVANTAAVTSPTDGLMVYDLSNSCVKAYENGAWSSCLSSSSQAVAVNCDVNGFEGIYTSGVALTASNKFSVTITNNTFSVTTISFAIADLVLSGVSGISVASVSPASATLNAGQSQLVTYTLSGTPGSVGTLTGTWAKLLSLNCVKTVSVAPPPAIASLNCAGATNNGGLTSGYAASGVSSVISYTGGDGSAYSGQTVASTGVTGLTATVAAGNFAVGAGSLTYTITGTPSSVGTASFAITIGGRTCTLTRSVGSIALAQVGTYFVASAYDQDYLPYTAPVGPATTNTQAANGVNEAVTLNVQGSITTTGVAVKIPVTATGSGTLPAYSTTITIPAALTEDGIGRDLTLSWPSQAFTAATTSINATIASVGGTLNAKKLDVNAGIGNDFLGVLMGTFTYPAGNSGTFQVRVISGIPDRNIANANHVMLYVPIVSATGKVWLNNNLGADYCNAANASFSPSQQGTSIADWKAYGSLFQWGRYSDGHELITWTSGTAGTPVNGTTATLSVLDTPGHANFITVSSGNYDWRSFANNTLWQGVNGANNPCPYGFRLPTDTELTAEFTEYGITNGATAYSSIHKFVVPGGRDFNNGALSFTGGHGNYWSSSVIGTSVYYRSFDLVATNSYTYYRAPAFSVRCLKD